MKKTPRLDLRVPFEGERRNRFSGLGGFVLVFSLVGVCFE